MTTPIKEFAAGGAGVGGESYSLIAFYVLAIAENIGVADVEPDLLMHHVISNALVIDDQAAIRSFLPGVYKKIKGFDELYLEAEEGSSEVFLGAYALAFNEMQSTREWTPLTFYSGDGEMIGTGVVGLHHTNEAAPVMLIAGGGTGNKADIDLHRLGLKDSTIRPAPELLEQAQNRLNSKQKKPKPNVGWAKFD